MPHEDGGLPLSYADPQLGGDARRLVRWFAYVAGATGIPTAGLALGSLAACEWGDFYGDPLLDVLDWTSGILMGVGGCVSLVLGVAIGRGRSRAARLLGWALVVQAAGLMLQGAFGVLSIRHTYEAIAIAGYQSSASLDDYLTPLMYWCGFALVPLLLGLCFMRDLVARLIRVG